MRTRHRNINNFAFHYLDSVQSTACRDPLLRREARHIAKQYIGTIIVGIIGFALWGYYIATTVGAV